MARETATRRACLPMRPGSFEAMSDQRFGPNCCTSTESCSSSWMLHGPLTGGTVGPCWLSILSCSSSSFSFCASTTAIATGGGGGGGGGRGGGGGGSGGGVARRLGGVARAPPLGRLPEREPGGRVPERDGFGFGSLASSITLDGFRIRSRPSLPPNAAHGRVSTQAAARRG